MIKKSPHEVLRGRPSPTHRISAGLDGAIGGHFMAGSSVPMDAIMDIEVPLTMAIFQGMAHATINGWYKKWYSTNENNEKRI